MSCKSSSASVFSVSAKTNDVVMVVRRKMMRIKDLGMVLGLGMVIFSKKD